MQSSLQSSIKNISYKRSVYDLHSAFHRDSNLLLYNATLVKQN